MHEPVLLDEVVRLLAIRAGAVFVDGTIGSGGHARAILERAGADACLLGLDRDEEALDRAKARLAGCPGRVVLRHGSFADIAGIAAEEGFDRVDGILLDLGVSSEQLDTPGRGFSFQADGPLDMRQNRKQALTAAELVNGLTETDLADLLRALGEEPRARRIARAVVEERFGAPITTTGRLAAIVERAAGGRRGRLHPATRTFQALRMAVNDEQAALTKGLESGLPLLKAGGRMAVIAFHRLEDNAVKRHFALHAGRWESLPAGGREWRGEEPAVRLLTRKPVTPSLEETERNPRSRSAKLRVAERAA